MMKIVLTIVGVTALAASALANDEATAFAKLHKIDSSGIKGTIILQETAEGTVVSGAATGLDPTKPYASLGYDLGSVPSGPMACIPTSSAPGLLGFWNVNSDGTGTLNMIVPALDVETIGAASIRIFNFNPELPRPLQACGRVHLQD